MSDKFFAAGFYEANRRRLRQDLAEDAVIVLTANGLLQRGGDSPYSFHQDSNFWYLTGIDEPDIVLVMDAGAEYLIIPERTVSRQVFDGSVDLQALTSISGIEQVYGEQAGWERLAAALRRQLRLATPAAAPGYIEQYGIYANPARRRLQRRLKAIAGDKPIIDLRPVLARARMVKQPPELLAIRRAVDITMDALQTVSAAAASATYAYEYELEADLTRLFRRAGASGHAFAPIVAGGRRACTLHNVANDSRLAPDELVVLDVGAEVEHYAADITRTILIGHSPPSGRQRQVYEAVSEVQDFALGLLKPGADLRDNERQIEKRMGQALRSLGLTDGRDAEAVRRYYPHSTSHFLGLDVHDVGDYSQPLEPGVVLTCEPGIYIAAEGIGVRLEDDVLITASGHEVLSGRLPKTLGAAMVQL